MLYRKAASPAEEHLRRQIAPMFMAERTPGRDGLRRHRLDGCRDILAATLALNHHALGAFRSGDMRNIGEQKAMLACQPMTISRYRKKAIRDGHLKIVKSHSYRSAGKGEATEFQFVGRFSYGLVKDALRG
jgi:hypothetical protein